MSSPDAQRSPSRATPAAIPPDDDVNNNTKPARDETMNGTTRSRSPSRGRTRSRSTSRRSRSRSHSPSRSRSTSHPRSAKIVIEKLTKNINEHHLQEIFASYGPIAELEMPMNKQFMTNRGIAYILYETASGAESAIAHMHEAQLDGALISVSIVLPRRRFSRSPPPRRPPPNRFGEPHRFREAPQRPPAPDRAYGRPIPPPRSSPPFRGGGGMRRSPGYRGGGRGGGGGGYRNRGDERSYRPRSYSPSRSPPPRRRRSRSPSSRYSSRSRSPPRRIEASPPRRGGGGGGGGGRRRRSPSYSSYGSRGRSASRDRARGGR